MIGKKSSLLIDREKVIKSFEFIKEGSKILSIENKNFLIFKKNFVQTIEFIKSDDFDLRVNFNSVMQGEFPTLEIKITFLKEKIDKSEKEYFIKIFKKINPKLKILYFKSGKKVFDWEHWTTELGKKLKDKPVSVADDLDYYYGSWLEALEELILSKEMTYRDDFKREVLFQVKHLRDDHH